MLLYETGKILKNPGKNGYRPLVRKQAKKAYKKLVNKATKNFARELAETASYKAIEWYTQKRMNMLYKKIM